MTAELSGGGAIFVAPPHNWRNTMIRNEFTKIFRTKLLYVAFVVGLLACLTGLVSYYDTAYWANLAGRPEEISAYNAWLDCLSIGSSVYRIIFPLIIIPFLDSYYLERKSGYQHFIISRTGKWKYFWTKWFVGAFSAAMIILAILSITFLVCSFLFPFNQPLSETSHLHKNFGIDWFLDSPGAYIFGLILCNMFCATIYFTVAFGFSNMVGSRNLLLLIPLILYLVQLVAWQSLRIPEFSPLVFIAYYEVIGLTPEKMFYVALGDILLAMIMLCVCYIQDTREII